MRLFVPEKADLVFLGRLPRESDVRASVHDQRVGLIVQIGRVGIREGRRISIESGEIRVGPPIAERIVEPELVAYEPAAPGRIDVPDLLQAVGRRQATVPQRVRQIARLHAFIRICDDEIAGKRVATLLRHEVCRDAGDRLFRGLPAGRDGHLLHAPLIDVVREAGAPARSLESVVVGAIDGHIRLARAPSMNGDRCGVAANVPQTTDDARNIRDKALWRPLTRKTVEHAVGQHGLRSDALDIDRGA